jgi:cytoskeletal protein RodZ
MPSVWTVLATIVAIGALAWWMSAQGPGEATSTPAPGSASDARTSSPQPSFPSVEPRPTVATDTGVPVPAETSPEAPSPVGPTRLEEDLPDSPSGGAVREPEATSTVPSGSAPRMRLPDTRPPPDDGRPLRGPETPLPGLPPAADPTLLPSRPPEDQGATSTR